MKLYIAVLDEVPDHMVPVLVAHTVMNAYIALKDFPEFKKWFISSFKKCVVSVNRKEFDKIVNLQIVYQGYETHTLNGAMSCVIPLPCEDDKLPNVLKFAKLWKPKSL